MLPVKFNWLLFGVALVLMAAPLMKIGRRVLLRRTKS
jgi:hypothetical protein